MRWFIWNSRTSCSSHRILLHRNQYYLSSPIWHLHPSCSDWHHRNNLHISIRLPAECRSAWALPCCDHRLVRWADASSEAKSEGEEEEQTQVKGYGGRKDHRCLSTMIDYHLWQNLWCWQTQWQWIASINLTVKYDDHSPSSRRLVWTVLWMVWWRKRLSLVRYYYLFAERLVLGSWLSNILCSNQIELVSKASHLFSTRTNHVFILMEQPQRKYPSGQWCQRCLLRLRLLTVMNHLQRQLIRIQSVWTNSYDDYMKCYHANKVEVLSNGSVEY